MGEWIESGRLDGREDRRVDKAMKRWMGEWIYRSWKDGCVGYMNG